MSSARPMRARCNLLILLTHRLEESGTVTRCEITTYESEPPMEMGFDDAAKIQRLIMKVSPFTSRLARAQSTDTSNYSRNGCEMPCSSSTLRLKKSCSLSRLLTMHRCLTTDTGVARTATT